MFHCISPCTAVNFSRLKHSCVFDCRRRSHVQGGSKFSVVLSSGFSVSLLALFQFCPPLFLHKSKTNKN